MARSFTAASSMYLSVSAGLTYPVTLVAWSYITSIASQRHVLQTTDTTGNNAHGLSVNSSGNVLSESNAGSSAAATSSTALSANSWNHIAGVFASATSRAAYLNGAGKSTNATSLTPSSISLVYVGVFRAGSSNFNLMQGRIAEAAIWSAALTDDEILALARGVNPRQMRPDTLWGYWPLWGIDSPERDMSGNARHATLVNSPTQADHAPVPLWRPKFMAAA